MKSCLCFLVLLPAVLSLTYTPGTDTCEGRCLDHYDLYNMCQCTENCELFGDCCIDFYFHCVETEPPYDENSCAGLCGLFTSGKPCQCNDGCVAFGDCCDDYDELCGGGVTADPGLTCAGRCDNGYEPDLPCQCNDQCESFDNCCGDYQKICLGVTPSPRPPTVDPGTTCAGRCDNGYEPGLACQCNDQCESFSNCCNDYQEICVGVDPGTTCEGRCDNGYEPDLPCQCNDQCEDFNNCCTDYTEKCVVDDPNSCKEKCGADYDSSLPCQCNVRCPEFGNCCPDYVTECSDVATCDGRCDDPFDGDELCQCNTACVDHGDCCLDYNEICLNGTGPQPITQAEITELAEILWSLDVNRLSPEDYVINKQSVADENNPADVSDAPFFTSLNESALSSRTYQAFIALMDNYISDTGNEEIYTLEELEEIQEFLDAVFESDVMNETTQFFINKGWYANEAEYRAFVEEVWFGNYSRKESDPFFDSSGFEHVFIGETRSSGITGFHNWLHFYFKEKAGELEYFGYLRENYPNQIGLMFTWKNYLKELGSMIIGSSPEFELAMMSFCFRVKGGSQCTFTLDNSTSIIQTYNIREKYIGSSYFVV